MDSYLRNSGSQRQPISKMFIASAYRDKAAGVAGLLLDILLQRTRVTWAVRLYLGTTDRLLAAHRFHEKNGFLEVHRTELPQAFAAMAVDTKFYLYG
jgi:GNAT superfamily N-acetyltransferase